MSIENLVVFTTATAALCAYGLFMLSLYLWYSLWLGSLWNSAVMEGLEPLF